MNILRFVKNACCDVGRYERLIHEQPMLKGPSPSWRLPQSAAAARYTPKIFLRACWQNLQMMACQVTHLLPSKKVFNFVCLLQLRRVLVCINACGLHALRLLLLAEAAAFPFAFLLEGLWGFPGRLWVMDPRASNDNGSLWRRFGVLDMGWVKSRNPDENPKSLQSDYRSGSQAQNVQQILTHGDLIE